MCTLGNCHFHLQLVVKWTHICVIVTIPSKLQLVKKWVLFHYGKGVKFQKMPFLNCSSSSSSSSSSSG